MYLKCGFISTFTHSPICEKLVKLLDAEGENNGSLGFKIIVGHRWCLAPQQQSGIGWRLCTRCVSFEVIMDQ